MLAPTKDTVLIFPQPRKSPGLLLLQGSHWIDPAGSPTGPPDGHDTSGAKAQCRGNQGKGIHGRYPVQLRPHQAADRERARHSGRHPDQQKQSPLPQEEPSDRRDVGSDRHADGDLVFPLLDRIGDHSVNPDQCQKRGEATEAGEQRREKTGPGQLLIEDRRKRL